MQNSLRLHEIRQSLDEINFTMKSVDVDSILPNPEQSIDMIKDFSNLSSLCLNFEDMLLSKQPQRYYDWVDLCSGLDQIQKEREEVASHSLLQSAQSDIEEKFNYYNIFFKEIMNQRNNDVASTEKYIENLDQKLRLLEKAIEERMNSTCL
ncbi:hypothetical protein GPJ56_002899 [Histomonas meleagridis]|uniref:uncharacterized protein n=1 Tax=Histomonas meleagridis TaxID=135588 RepID=UPI00355A1BDB|nr:hypothetical protein GPJ56_002899 [Histomonas meleagridis]KAH0800400.1 hypothetical protein GO595_006811 [Histomonas meleagridis]